MPNVKFFKYLLLLTRRNDRSFVEKDATVDYPQSVPVNEEFRCLIIGDLSFPLRPRSFDISSDSLEVSACCSFLLKVLDIDWNRQRNRNLYFSLVDAFVFHSASNLRDNDILDTRFGVRADESRHEISVYKIGVSDVFDAEVIPQKRKSVASQAIRCVNWDARLAAENADQRLMVRLELEVSSVDIFMKLLDCIYQSKRFPRTENACLYTFYIIRTVIPKSEPPTCIRCVTSTSHSSKLLLIVVDLVTA
uniref:Uncharacterized protein n=1 Tax=Photinus pyralis TaxID=7054 RepID=A0A1Y1LC27_PHOPY